MELPTVGIGVKELGSDVEMFEILAILGAGTCPSPTVRVAHSVCAGFSVNDSY